MYKEAASLGIDLMGYDDSDHSSTERQDRRKTEIYKVTLVLKGKKPEEYTLEISLSGFFSVESENELTDALKNSLVVKNSVAIMMPYLRSQVSLVTAQPEVECVVLPAFNINKMLDNE